MYCRICQHWRGQQFNRCRRYRDEDSNCLKRREMEVLKLIREAERLIKGERTDRKKPLGGQPTAPPTEDVIPDAPTDPASPLAVPRTRRPTPRQKT